MNFFGRLKPRSTMPHQSTWTLDPFSREACPSRCRCSLSPTGITAPFLLQWTISSSRLVNASLELAVEDSDRRKFSSTPLGSSAVVPLPAVTWNTSPGIKNLIIANHYPQKEVGFLSNKPVFWFIFIADHFQQILLCVLSVIAFNKSTEYFEWVYHDFLLQN